MILKTFIQTPFQQNTRVIACEATREAICIDPGEPSDDLNQYIHDNGLDLKVIALTHGHLDHIGGTAALKRKFPNAEVLLHEGDNDYYYGLPRQPLMMGMEPHQLVELGMDYEDPPELTRSFVHGQTLEIGDLRFSVRHCPGHTAGHVVLVLESERAVFTGDCLFSGSIGRTDLPGGNYEQLMDSIREQVLSLGDDYTVCCGHGPDTTIGHERLRNPFLNGSYSPPV